MLLYNWLSHWWLSSPINTSGKSGGAGTKGYCLIFQNLHAYDYSEDCISNPTPLEQNDTESSADETSQEGASSSYSHKASHGKGASHCRVASRGKGHHMVE